MTRNQRVKYLRDFHQLGIDFYKLDYDPKRLSNSDRRRFGNYECIGYPKPFPINELIKIYDDNQLYIAPDDYYVDYHVKRDPETLHNLRYLIERFHSERNYSFWIAHTTFRNKVTFVDITKASKELLEEVRIRAESRKLREENCFKFEEKRWKHIRTLILKKPARYVTAYHETGIPVIYKLTDGEIEEFIVADDDLAMEGVAQEYADTYRDTLSKNRFVQSCLIENIFTGERHIFAYGREWFFEWDYKGK